VNEGLARAGIFEGVSPGSCKSVFIDDPARLARRAR
jgi:hypothetical protein